MNARNFPKVFIVEDEPLITLTIQTALKKQGFRIVGSGESYTEALPKILELQPDVILLDIELHGDKDGIDLALELEKQKIPFIYLTSQTDHNTVDRVKLTSPLGFIAKPFTENSLRSNIDLAWHRHMQETNDYILLKIEGVHHKINQNDITHLKAFDNYCFVCTALKNYIVPHTLKKVSADLNKQKFIKVHRSYWVNLQKVIAIDKKTIKVPEHEIPLSNSNRELFLKKMGEL